MEQTAYVFLCPSCPDRAYQETFNFGPTKCISVYVRIYVFRTYRSILYIIIYIYHDTLPVYYGLVSNAEMEENVHSDLFLAVEDGDIDKVVEIITSKGISPTVKNKVRGILRTEYRH